MDMTISIPDDVAARLRERAAQSGQSIDAYTATLVSETVRRPSLDELLAPVQADFVKSGMTENELLDLGRELLEKARSDTKG